MSGILAPNTLAFMALANEYCQALETAESADTIEFTASMTRLLPRIYISATDLSGAVALDEYSSEYIDNVLSEDYYNSIRLTIENLFGAEDVYLEVFEEDMKYSDTPISASIAEGLSDIFQVLYNFLEAVRDAPNEIIESAVTAVKEEFDTYWSRILCNVMRPLDRLRCENSHD